MANQVSHQGDGFFLIMSGKATIDEINDANGRIIGHHDFDSHKFQLVYTLDADFSEIDPKDARITGATDSVASKMRADVKVAIVATDSRVLEFAQNYIDSAKRLGSNWEIKIFAELEPAMDWVGISPVDLPDDFPRVK